MRAAGRIFRIVLFVILTLILGAAAYNLWWELAVIRCRPDTCGAISDFAWDYQLPLLIVCVLLVGSSIWAVGRALSRVRHSRERNITRSS